MDDFFDEKVKEIKKKYKDLKLDTLKREKESDGWRFLYCPKSKITDNNGLLILGLNPGAGYEKKDRERPSVEEKDGGNVYLHPWNVLFTLPPEYEVDLKRCIISDDLKSIFKENEKDLSESARIKKVNDGWDISDGKDIYQIRDMEVSGEKIDDKLQRNVKGLFKKVSKKCGNTWEDIIRDSLTSNFIPFRSKDISELAKLKLKKECFGFSRELWTGIIEKNYLKVIICLDNSEKDSSYSNVKEILEKRYGDFKTEKRPIWGTGAIKYSKIMADNKKLLLVGLPHLSHFGFVVIKDDNNKDIERPESKKAVDEISYKIA